MKELSIFIPARNEEFLNKTVESILDKIRGDSEIILLLDGKPKSPIVHNVQVIQYEEGTGQRKMLNDSISKLESKYIMKCDAHCLFDEGFDVKLMASCESDTIVVPRMKKLHVFNLVCLHCGREIYQGNPPKGCEKCGHDKFNRKMFWEVTDESKYNDFMCFNSDLQLGSWPQYAYRKELKENVVECLAFLGTSWIMQKDMYSALDGFNERFGKWGKMGVEQSLKIWLSGGRLLVHRGTWCAHLFREPWGDFSFPYLVDHLELKKANEYFLDFWKNDRWDKAKFTLIQLIKKFWPVDGWEDRDLINPEDL